MSDWNGPRTDDLGRRIRRLRGRRSRDRFARQLGIHKNTLARYEKGERLPDALMLHRLCTVCGVSADWLIHERAIGPDAASRWRSPDHDGLQWSEPPLLLHRTWLESRGVPADRLLIRAMEGDCMVPTLGDGDMLFVFKADDAAFADGIYLLQLDGQAMVKRLHGAGTRSAQLVSDNPSYPTLPAHAAMEDGRLQVIGPVLWHLRRL